MRPIDGDALLAKYKEKANGNRNIEALIKIVESSIEQMPTLDFEPQYYPPGNVIEYNNGMVTMCKETYLEYNRCVMETLPKKYDQEEFTALDYLQTLRKMHENKTRKQFFAMFPQNLSDEEKVEFVKNWKYNNLDYE